MGPLVKLPVEGTPVPSAAVDKGKAREHRCETDGPLLTGSGEDSKKPPPLTRTAEEEELRVPRSRSPVCVLAPLSVQ